MLGMTKAKFKILDGKDGMKLKVSALLGSAVVPCVFNPESFTVERSVNYVQHQIPGSDRPVLQYVGGTAEVMSFSLLFDTYSAGIGSEQAEVAASTLSLDAAKTDVRMYTDPLMKLTTVNSDTHTPSLVEFAWGTISFTGYIQSMSQRFTMFNMLGKPVRAVIDLTLISNKADSNIRNSPDRTKARTVSEGDRLCTFAYAEYGDCGEWRRIAEENGIDNPRVLSFGTNIVVPPIL